MSDEIEIFASGLTQDVSLFVEPILEDVRLDVIISETREDVQLNVQPNLIEINLIRTVASAFADITGLPSDNDALNSVLNAKADLVDGKVPSVQLPSYVDDVIEVANFAALPSTGESSKIYITIDNNKIYRWSGSTYVEIVDSTAVWGAITGTLSSQTDLQNALNGKFNNPTGNTTQYIAGDGSLITFPISGQAGTLVREVRNTTGATLTKGTVVYISGASGNKPTISKALATSDSTSAQTFGLLQANIANNANGYVVCVGDLSGLDTSEFSEGAQLYLSYTTAGTYTTIKQLAPAHLVYIGVVTRSHPTLGQIEVKIQNGYELDEIHDVAISSKVNNQFLVYESASDLWKNKSLATVLGGTSSQFVKGNGTLDSNSYYLASNPNGYTNNVGTVTSVGLSTTTPGVSVNFSPITTSGNITLAIATASGSQQGLLSATDWNTFNNKQNALTNPITGTGFVKANGTTISYDNNTYLTGITGTQVTTALGYTPYNSTNPSAYINQAGARSALSLTTTGNSGASTYNSTTGVINVPNYTLAGLGGQPLLTNPVTGTGTTNYLSKFTGASTLGNSLLFDNGTNVGLGTTSPTAKLQVESSNITAFIKSTSNPVPISIFNSGSTVSTIGFKGSTTTNEYVVRAGADADNFVAYTNDTERLRITSSGNVGIGTTSPSRKLTIGGADNAYMNFAATNYRDYVIGSESQGLVFYDGTAASYRMVINPSGNVGIGTTSPSSILEVAGVGRFTGSGGRSVVVNGTSIGRIDINGDGAVYATGILFNSQLGGTALSGIWNFGSGTSQQWLALGGTAYNNSAMYILPTGNVGIGTSSPDAPLDIENTNSTSIIYQRIGVAAKKWGFVSDNGATYWSNITDNTLPFTLTNSGNVGIGTTSPSAKLTIIAPFTSGIPAAYIEEGEYNQVTLRIKNTNGSASANIFEVANSSSNIFTVSPSGAVKTGTLTSGTTAAPFKIGQISSGAPTLINKLEVEIDGVIYYIPASIGTV